MDSVAIQLPPRSDLPRYEQPPNAPYDPPQPAPQAAAWRRALKVVNGVDLTGVAGTRVTVARESIAASRDSGAVSREGQGAQERVRCAL